MHTRLAGPVAVLLLLACSPAAGAQGIARSFEQLQLLVRPGDTVSIRDAAGTETTGKIDSLTSSSLTLVTSGRRLDVREADVSTILQRRGDSLGNGALWGLATGWVLGGGLMAAGCGDCGAGVVVIVGAFYGGIGAGIGVGVDALISHRLVIYDRRSGVAALRVAPLLGQGRRGVALSATF